MLSGPTEEQPHCPNADIHTDDLLAEIGRLPHINCRCTPEGNVRALEEMQGQLRTALKAARRRTAERN
jgi:hypothetical protein